MLLSVRAKVLQRKCREGFFFKLGIVGVKEKSWNQEVDKEAIGRGRGAEKPPKPVKSLCVSVWWIMNVCVCVCMRWVCACECECLQYGAITGYLSSTQQSPPFRD